MTATYTCDIDTGDGGTTTVQAATLADACGQAREWAAAGTWREDGSVIVRVSGPDGEERIDVDVTASD